MSEIILDFVDKCRLCLSEFNIQSQAIEIDEILSEQLEELIGFVRIFLRLLLLKIN